MSLYLDVAKLPSGRSALSFSSVADIISAVENILKNEIKENLPKTDDGTQCKLLDQKFACEEVTISKVAGIISGLFHYLNSFFICPRIHLRCKSNLFILL